MYGTDFVVILHRRNICGPSSPNAVSTMFYSYISIALVGMGSRLVQPRDGNARSGNCSWGVLWVCRESGAYSWCDNWILIMVGASGVGSGGMGGGGGG